MGAEMSAELMLHSRWVGIYVEYLVLKENEPRMWDNHKYEPYLRLSHVRGSFSFYYMPFFPLNNH